MSGYPGAPRAMPFAADARDATLRVLIALDAELAEHGRATVRAVAERAGRSLATTHRHLRRLRELGLVSWEDGHEGTLRLSCARVLLPAIDGEAAS